MAAIDMNHLPIESLLETFPHLNPEFVSKLGIVSKKFKNAANNNPFWKEKFKRHFLHRIEEVSTQDYINWHDQFRKTYEDEYKNIPKNLRKLFSLIKENNTEDYVLHKKIN